jgi:hypothetical protein
MKFLLQLLGGIGCSATFGLLQTPSLLAHPEVDRAAQHLIGSMDTAQRAAQNPKVSNVTMTTCRTTVPTANPDRIYLYQEQALSQELAKPYRQRILELSWQPFSQTVRSRAFKLSHPSKVVNFCNQMDRTIALTAFPEAICSVFLKPTPTGFVGTTPADGCPTTARGAVRIRNRIELHELGMDTWDRGFDAQGQQIWGAKTESYQFRWQRSP